MRKKTVIEKVSLNECGGSGGGCSASSSYSSCYFPNGYGHSSSSSSSSGSSFIPKFDNIPKRDISKLSNPELCKKIDLSAESIIACINASYKKYDNGRKIPPKIKSVLDNLLKACEAYRTLYANA